MKRILYYSQKAVNSGIPPIIAKINGKEIQFTANEEEGSDFYSWDDKIKVGEYDENVDTFKLLNNISENTFKNKIIPSYLQNEKVMNKYKAYGLLIFVIYLQ